MRRSSPRRGSVRLFTKRHMAFPSALMRLTLQYLRNVATSEVLARTVDQVVFSVQFLVSAFMDQLTCGRIICRHINSFAVKTGSRLLINWVPSRDDFGQDPGWYGMTQSTRRAVAAKEEVSMPAAAKYREIAEALRQQIEAGTLAVGDQLPTEQALISQYDASRSTIRQALQELRDAGLVDIRHGVGAFVAPPPVVKRLDSRERLARARRERNQAAFLAEAAEQGFTPTSTVRVWFEPAQDYAKIFGLTETDELCVRDRVMRADGRPVMLAVSRLPREITQGTALEEVDTGPGGAHARLEEAGYELTYHEEIVGAKVPDSTERQLLDISGGAVLTVRRLTWSGERVVEVNDMVMSGATYELRYGWPAD